MSDKITCQNCGGLVDEDDVYTTDGKTFCEDCYIDQSHKIRVCDPWAERSKRVYRERLGLEGTDGLTDLQKDIIEFIKSKGKATRIEIAEQFKLPPTELENEFAILRHCQLLNGRKEGDIVYIVPW